VVVTLGALKQPALDPLGLTRVQFEQNPRQTTSLALPQEASGQADRFNTRKDTRQRSGAELLLARQIAPAWCAQPAASHLNARYVDGFTVCRVLPCTTPDLPVAPGNRIAGTVARTGYAELA
jgi:iron complex outermembrane receptor protein